MHPIHPTETQEGFPHSVSPLPATVITQNCHDRPRALLSIVLRNRPALSLLKRCSLPKTVYGGGKSVFSAMIVFNLMGTLTLAFM